MIVIIRNTMLVGAALLALTACAQQPVYTPVDALPPPNLLGNPGSAKWTTVRVIITFKQDVAYDDAQFLQTLQDRTLTQLHYVTSVSANTHVYSLDVPADQDPAAAMQRLRAFPSIARVETDRAVKAY